MDGGGGVGLVLVHGGGHDARCWDRLIDAVAAQSDVRVLAVDLPGRGTHPGPLRGLTVAACVDAVVDQIRGSELQRMVLVGHSMAGMMSESDMTALEATKGAAFDKAFLTMMIEHHEGALTMARAVESKGSSPEVAALADAIISGQTEQITTMNQLLTE